MGIRYSPPRTGGWPLALLLALAAFQAADASRLVLRVKAANPLDREQTVAIRTSLPEGVSSNDVVNLDGLELGYDVQNAVYFVHKQVALGPKQVRDFNVEIRDVWSIPPAELDALAAQAAALTAKLAGRELAESAAALRKQVDDTLERIRQTQKENAVGQPGVSAVQHIGAHEANMKLLGRVRRDIGHIENLVMESGLDPGALIGEDARALRLRRDIELPKGEYRTATVRVSVRNTSATEKRLIDVRQQLPPELGVADVLNAGGLQVGADPETGVCYVFQNGVEVGPGATVQFDVTVRDVWNINGPRIGALMANASNVLERVVKREAFASVEKILNEAIAELAAVADERGPEKLGPDYVAFYRAQARRLDDLEQRINRVRAALQPIEKTNKFGFKHKAPSMRTTWLIIYGILGFLAVMSLLFFLRWYGKTREDRMWEALEQTRKEGGGGGGEK